MELLEDVNEVDLVVAGYILADDAIKLLVELNNSFGLLIFSRNNDFFLAYLARLFFWWQLGNWSWLEESVPSRFRVADEAQVARISNRIVSSRSSSGTS